MAWNLITYIEINVQTQNGFVIGPQNAQVHNIINYVIHFLCSQDFHNFFQYGVQFLQVEWPKEEKRILIKILANSRKEEVKT